MGIRRGSRREILSRPDATFGRLLRWRRLSRLLATSGRLTSRTPSKRGALLERIGNRQGKVRLTGRYMPLSLTTNPTPSVSPSCPELLSVSYNALMSRCVVIPSCVTFRQSNPERPRPSTEILVEGEDKEHHFVTHRLACKIRHLCSASYECSWSEKLVIPPCQLSRIPQLKGPHVARAVSGMTMAYSHPGKWRRQVGDRRDFEVAS